MKPFQIWIDADACPKSIKEVIFKISGRIECPVTLVANSEMFIPKTPLVKLVKVKKDMDAADHYIVEHVSSSDIVITADIPLAALIVEKGALAIDVRGEIYTTDNVQERLSMRDFMKSLRDSGMEVGGPANFDAKDKEKFTNALNKIIDKKMREL
ncbi:MAG: YaiI/YqxD family protein [Bacteriovoracaceae bacterium]|nr:YaiI/YqxD family protein [Bacteriovoracaceae bacterium]